MAAAYERLTSRPRATGEPRFADFSRGTSQSGTRLYNERLVLSLIRRHGSVPKAEIARLTGLSAQTASVIIRQLEADGLVLKGGPQRGRVGQPSVPFTLDPEGAFALGLKIGRRSSDIVLLDFLGTVRGERRLTHPYPQPRGGAAFVREGIPALSAMLPAARLGRIVGLGVAAPFELWNWEEGSARRRGARSVARVRHPSGDRRAQPVAGQPVQRCHGRLRRRADPGGGRTLRATISTCSSAPSSAAAWC